MLSQCVITNLGLKFKYLLIKREIYLLGEWLFLHIGKRTLQQYRED